HLASLDSAAAFFNQVAQRRAEGELVDSRTVDVVVKREDHRARAFGCAKSSVPLGAMQKDRRHIGKSLHVVDRRRFAEEPDRNRKWRLLARPRFLSFDHFESRGIFAGDVIVRSGGNLYGEAEIAP